MRHVAQQRLLVRDQRLQLLGHRVEVTRERADLVAAAIERPADARRQRPRREGAARLLELDDRRRQITREQQRRDARCDDRRRQHAELRAGPLQHAENRRRGPGEGERIDAAVVADQIPGQAHRRLTFGFTSSGRWALRMSSSSNAFGTSRSRRSLPCSSVMYSR